jgi:hypothetical protein
VAEEAVVDFVGGAHVCGAVDGAGEMLGAFDAGELVGVRLALAAVHHGAVHSCTSRRELWRESESEARHGCDGIFSVDVLIWCASPLRE